MNWKQAFQDYATSVAFSIQLSKAQVRAIDAIANDTWLGGDFTMFFATATALKRRGLVEYNEAYRDRENAPWRYRLTPAGELVHQLLKLSEAIAADKERGAA